MSAKYIGRKGGWRITQKSGGKIVVQSAIVDADGTPNAEIAVDPRGRSIRVGAQVRSIRVSRSSQ